MLKRYEKFLKDFDEIVKSIFEDQKRYIKCKKVVQYVVNRAIILFPR